MRAGASSTTSMAAAVAAPCRHGASSWRRRGGKAGGLAGAAGHPAFVESDAEPAWVPVDPNLVVAWACDWSMTTADTSARRLLRLDEELTKIS